MRIGDSDISLSAPFCVIHWFGAMNMNSFL